MRLQLPAGGHGRKCHAVKLLVLGMIDNNQVGVVACTGIDVDEAAENQENCEGLPEESNLELT